VTTAPGSFARPLLRRRRDLLTELARAGAGRAVTRRAPSCRRCTEPPGGPEHVSGESGWLSSHAAHEKTPQLVEEKRQVMRRSRKLAVGGGGAEGGRVLLHLGPGVRQAIEGDEVYFVEAKGDDTEVRTRGARMLKDVRPMGVLAAAFLRHGFVRIHRDYPSSTGSTPTEPGGDDSVVLLSSLLLVAVSSAAGPAAVAMKPRRPRPAPFVDGRIDIGGAVLGGLRRGRGGPGDDTPWRADRPLTQSARRSSVQPEMRVGLG
jgi:hypothetical protein